MSLVTRRFAKLRELPYAPLLERRVAAVQLGKNRKQRLIQAKQAFTCTKQLDEEMIYVLVDDVVTTGATMRYAAKALHAAGAKTVWVVSISRQILD